MGYSPVPTVVTGDLWTAANHNTYVKDNLAALWPYLAAGDVAVASGANALARLAIGSAYQVQRVKADLSGLEYVDGGMFLIEEHLCAVDEATIEFTGIPQFFRNLKIVVTMRGTGATAPIGYLQFNGDTGANYDYQTLQEYGTTLATTVTFGANQIPFGIGVHATGLAGSAGIASVEIPDYRGVWKKSLIAEATMKYQESSAGIENRKFRGYWRDTDPITSIKLFLSTGNLAANSVASLYGII